jgi:hypothetical protein
MLKVPFWLALKAEALHLAGRASEALQAIRETEVVVERSSRLQLGISRGSPEQVIGGWRHFGCRLADGEDDASRSV